MKIFWIPLIFLLSFLNHVSINGDTYHYQVIRKICPSGTYHDPMKDKCRKVPGGGEMIKINLDSRCSGGFLGLLAHSKKSKYYFVCKKDGVLTCMCKPKEHFSRIRLKCEDKCRKDEEFTHDVVDHIMDKYKCAIMNGVYEDGLCLLPLTTTTIDPQITSRSLEDFDHEKIDRLQKILNYLIFLRKLDNQFRSHEESIERTSLIPSEITDGSTVTPDPRNFITEFTTEPSEPRFFNPIEAEISEFKRIWNLDATIPVILATTDLTGKSLDDDNSTTTVSSKAFDVLNAENTTVIQQDTTTETTPRFESEKTTTNDDLSTTEETSTLHPTLSPRIIKSRKSSRKITTENPETEIEEYFEYFYEDDPGNILFVSNATKKTVSGRAFDDYEEDNFEEIRIVHQVVTGKVEYDYLNDTTQQPIADELRKSPMTTETTKIYDETTLKNQDSTTASEETTERITTTSTEFDTSSLRMEEFSTTEELETTSIMPPAPLIKKFPGDLNFNDFDPMLMQNIEFSDDSISTVAQEHTESTTKYFEDSSSTKDFSTTTDEIQKTDSEDMPSTTEKLETTSTHETIVDDGTTDYYQSTTESIDPKFDFDESTTIIFDEPSTSEMTTTPVEFESTTDIITSTTDAMTSTTEISTMDSTTPITESETESPMAGNVNFKFHDSEFTTDDSVTINEDVTSSTEYLTSTTNYFITTTDILNENRYQSILESTVSESSEDTSTVMGTTTDSPTFAPESSTLLDNTSTIKVKDISEEDSEEDLKKIISTTLKIPRSMKIRANTEASTLNNLETTTILNISNDESIKNVTEKTDIEVDDKVKVNVNVEEIKRLTMPLLKNESKEEKPKDIEYYYEFEEYEVNDDGLEIKPQTVSKEVDKLKSQDGVTKILRKQRRDNSDEYYAESISASLEDRKRAKDDYNYFF